VAAALDHQIRKQPWWEQLMTVVGKKGVHRPIGDKVATPARRVQLPIGWVARRTHAGESAHRQPSARTTGSAPPAGSTELRPFSRLLERFALLLERSPLGPFWPIGFVVIFQLLAFVLSVFVWVWRGRVWPVACGYPRTTTRGRKPCRNRVFGEWSRCHLHRRRWRRATDSHEVDPTLRR